MSCKFCEKVDLLRKRIWSSIVDFIILIYLFSCYYFRIFRLFPIDVINSTPFPWNSSCWYNEFLYSVTLKSSFFNQKFSIFHLIRIPIFEEKFLWGLPQDNWMLFVYNNLMVKVFERWVHAWTKSWKSWNLKPFWFYGVPC